MNKTPTRETMSNRLRAVFSPALRSERGALNNALILTVAATLLVVVAATWFMFRQTLDTTTAQQAQVRSSINQLATNILGEMNREFPKEWSAKPGDPDFNPDFDLVEATKQFGNTPELGANSHLTLFQVNPDTGVVIAEAEGKSTSVLGTTAKARIQFVPSGAGVFTGLDEQGRPVWVYSNDNLDALALWELNPNSIEYLNPGGDYTSEAPTEPPVVTLTPRNGGASIDASMSATYCQFGGTAEYRWRIKMDNGEFGAWSAWGKEREFTRTLVQGQKIAVQAMTRCVTSISATDPTEPGPIAEYTRAINAPAGPPTLTIANTGVASWTAVACATGTQAQYQYRVRLNEGSWAVWSEWAAESRSYATGANQGARIEAQVRARCISPYAISSPTAEAKAQLDRPITSVPATPTVSVTNGSNGVTTSVSTVAGVTGLTAEYRYRVRINGGTFTWSAWGTVRQTTNSVNQGDTVEGQGQTRYASPYLKGTASAESAIVKLNVPVSFKPAAPTLTMASNFTTWTLGTVTCPAGTTTRYSWTSTINGTTKETYSNISPQQFTRVVNLLEGQTLNVTATAVCLGTTTNLYGPVSDARKLDVTRNVSTPPTTPAISYAANGAASWVKGGCPSGTVWESRSRYQTNGGGWTAWTAFSAASSISSPIGQGERVQVSAEARCKAGSMAGPTASATGAWHIYLITAQPTVGGTITINGDGPVTFTVVAPTNCPSTTTARRSWRYATNDSWGDWSAYGTGTGTSGSINIVNGNVARAQLRAMCVSSYDEGPVYTYTAVSKTTKVTAVSSGTPTVTWAAAYNTFSYAAVTCPSPTTIQYQFRTRVGENGTWTSYGSWGGRVSSTAISSWNPGDSHAVQLQTRCINAYSNAAGPVTTHTAVKDWRDIPKPGLPSLSPNAATSAISYSGNACPAGSNLLTEYRDLGRVHWAGAYNENANYEYTKNWSAWGTQKSGPTIAEQGRSFNWWVDMRCRNTVTGKVSPTATASAGWRYVTVKTGTPRVYRVGYRHFAHSLTCSGGAWGDAPHFWVTMNRSTGWSWDGPYWSYNNQGGNWGATYSRSQAYCKGPYTRATYQYASLYY